MRKTMIRSVSAALLLVGAIATAATAGGVPTGGTSGGGSPGGGGTPGGGSGPKYPPEVKMKVKEIVKDGQDKGLPPSQIKQNVRDYLKSVGF